MVKILKIQGAQSLALLNSFYTQYGGRPLARESDVFFYALECESILGAVRFCLEEETPLLRSMLIHPDFRRQGLGRQLLIEFEAYLIAQNIKNTFCLPYEHLESFYGEIGFKKIDESDAPLFLRERLVEYRKKPQSFICMSRN